VTSETIIPRTATSSHMRLSARFSTKRASTYSTPGQLDTDGIQLRWRVSLTIIVTNVSERGVGAFRDLARLFINYERLVAKRLYSDGVFPNSSHATARGTKTRQCWAFVTTSSVVPRDSQFSYKEIVRNRNNLSAEFMLGLKPTVFGMSFALRTMCSAA
jgi:hypothetical protein